MRSPFRTDVELARRALRVLPFVALATQICVGVALAATLPVAKPADIGGSVQCSSGRPVVGVWIEGFNGGSQFASIRRDETDPKITDYAYRLPDGGAYQVRVGCGGRPGDWADTVLSSYVGGASHDFVCHDVRHERDHGRCVLR